MSQITCLLSGWSSVEAAQAYWSVLQAGTPALAPAAGRVVDHPPRLQGLADAPSRGFSESARRRLALQHDEAVAFWRSLVPPLEGETALDEAVGFLADQDDSGLPKHAFVFRRHLPEGEIWLVVPGLRLKLDGRRVSAGHDPSMLPASVTPVRTVQTMKAMVSGWDIASEVSSVASLIGMAAITANPPIGIAVMISGQVLTFIFQQFGRSGRQPAIPSAEEIHAAIKGALKDQYIVTLADKAAVLWALIERGFNEGWDERAPDHAAYVDFTAWLESAVVPDKGAEVTKANITLALHLADKEEHGYQEGLKYFPNFLAAGGIEVLALQLLVLRAGAESTFGTGRDPQKNQEYRDAVDRAHRRMTELVDAATTSIKSAQAEEQRRLGQISGLTEKSAITIQVYPSANSELDYDYVITDGGGYPPSGFGSSGFIVGHYATLAGCCSTTRYGTTPDQAEAAHAAKVEELRKRCRAAFGIPDIDAQQAALANWRRAVEDITKARVNMPLA